MAPKIGTAAAVTCFPTLLLLLITIITSSPGKTEASSEVGYGRGWCDACYHFLPCYYVTTDRHHHPKTLTRCHCRGTGHYQRDHAMDRWEPMFDWNCSKPWTIRRSCCHDDTCSCPLHEWGSTCVERRGHSQLRRWVCAYRNYRTLENYAWGTDVAPLASLFWMDTGWTGRLVSR